MTLLADPLLNGILYYSQEARKGFHVRPGLAGGGWCLP